MEAKEKEKRNVHGCLYLVYRFYYSPFFLIGQIVIAIFFVLYAFITPFVVMSGIQELGLIQHGIYTEARILGDPVKSTVCCNDYYDYRLVFYLLDGSTAEVTITLTDTYMNEHREGDTVQITYAESNPTYVQIGEVKNSIQDWVMGLGLIFSILFGTGYFVIGAILVKIYYPKPKIKVPEPVGKPEIIEG